MAQGDLTKVIEYDKIEIVLTWNVQVRKATIIMEEQADGSKKELNRTFERMVFQPTESSYEKDSDGKITWTHTDTDMSGQDATVRAIAAAAWTDTVKSNYNAWVEANKVTGN